MCKNIFASFSSLVEGHNNMTTFADSIYLTEIHLGELKHPWNYDLLLYFCVIISIF